MPKFNRYSVLAIERALMVFEFLSHSKRGFPPFRNESKASDFDIDFFALV